MADAMKPPLVLCGPLLRRTSREGVSVWLLLARPALLRLEVLHSDSEKLVAVSASVRTSPVGRGAHVALLTATAAVPSEGLPVDVLLSYRVRELDQVHQPLAGGVDTDALGLFFEPFARPTFCICSAKAPRPVYFGSCNKLSSTGGDVAPSLVRSISVAYRERDARRMPQALLLLGDQVYTDDLSDLCFAAITTVRGWIGDCDSFDLELESQNDRLKYVREFFSATTEIHLLSFREIASQYILAWNPRVWQVLNVDSAYSMEASAQEWMRVLANVPSYMMFDDHEVTDDWNLNDRWMRRSHAHRGARRIVANALAAYWLFQGWGNVPARYGPATAEGSRSHRILASLPTAVTKRPEEDEALEDLMSRQRDWSYSSPTFPSFLFIDTRANRVRDRSASTRDTVHDSTDWDDRPTPRARLSDVLLRSNAGMRDLVEEIRGESRQFGLFVVSPSPVFGAAEVEKRAAEAHQDGLANLFRISAERLDLEGWFTNPNNVISLVRNLLHASAARSLVTLSGDVHYSFACNGLIRTRSHSPIRFLQVTSSSMRNAPRFPEITWWAELATRLERGDLVRTTQIWNGPAGGYRVADFWEKTNEVSSEGARRYGSPILEIARRYWPANGRTRTRNTNPNVMRLSFPDNASVLVELIDSHPGRGDSPVFRRLWSSQASSIDDAA